jgi:OOP family OmpA-OmpF porin
MKKRAVLGLVAALTIIVGLWGGGVAAQAQEVGNEHPWNFSLGPGFGWFEGDAPVKSAFNAQVRAGYDFSEHWSFEGVLTVYPYLESTYYFDFVTGTEVATLSEQSGTDATSTWAAGLALEGLYHFSRYTRLDPYLSAGVGFQRFGVTLVNNADLSLVLGGGVMYHFNDEWAARADVRTTAFGSPRKSEATLVSSVGVNWTWGAHLPPAYRVSGGPKDSDMDGLSDAEELELGTDPYDPDTDKDGLSDFDEVRKYKTDPLNPDTDYDGLKDGAEVYTHSTNPLDRDTDKGGVADGHEVIEDSTNPLDPSDDLQLFELNINFDFDKAILKPEYFAQLDVIAKVLQRDPGATARVEGHADKLKKSVQAYNQKLSELRARSVVDYLVTKGDIDRSRLTPVGYGFSRPKAPNDATMGNPVNRRVEVYIRKSGQVAPVKVPGQGETPAVMPAPAPAPKAVSPADK